MLTYNFSGFADEIAPELDAQIATLKEIGVEYMELRSVDKINVGDFTMDFAKEIKEKLDANGIKVSAIGSPIGKIKLDEDFEAHFEKYKHVVELAKLFGTKYIRMFSFYIDKEDDPDKYFDQVIANLKRFLEYAKEQDIILLHENEKGIYGDTPERCKKIFDELFCENFRCTYDPANYVQCGCDTAKAFDLLAPYVEYMHIKDARMSDGLVVPPGQGDGQIKTLMEKLSARNYNGFISLEPHLKKFAGLEALENGENLSVNENADFDGATAFKLAHKCLSEIIATVE